jgi:hypothetical protein
VPQRDGQTHAAKAEADYLLAESMPGLGQFLDRRLSINSISAAPGR